jgi:hypothetical protein
MFKSLKKTVCPRQPLKYALLSIILIVLLIVFFDQSFADSDNEPKRKVDKLFVDAKPTDKNTSVLSINNYGSLVPEIVNLEIPSKIYDVSMVAYTKEYADRFGYPYSHVEEMSDGVDVMQFRLETEGSQNNCRIDLVLDKSIDANLPGENYFHNRYLKMIHYPEKKEEYIDKKNGWMGYKINEVDRTYFSNRETEHRSIRQNLSIATNDYKYREQGMRVDGLFLIDHYSNDYLEDKVYLTILFGCSSLFYKLFSQPEIEVWIPKKEISELTSDKKNFTTIKIPERLRTFAKKLLFELEYRNDGQIKKELIRKTNGGLND